MKVFDEFGQKLYETIDLFPEYEALAIRLDEIEAQEGYDPANPSDEAKELIARVNAMDSLFEKTAKEAFEALIER